MIVKEKIGSFFDITKADSLHKDRKKSDRDVRLGVIKWTFAFLCGMIFSTSKGFIPISPALTAALSAAFSSAVFAGSAASIIARGQAESFVTEMLAMAVMLALKIIVCRFTERRLGSAGTGIFAAVVYILSGAVASLSAKITAALAAAVFFRGIICGITAYFISCEMRCVKENGRVSVTGANSLCTAVLYVTGISVLFGVSAGTFSLGRAMGIFVILAAGGRFGGAGGAIMGVLTSLGAILGCSGGEEISELSRSMAVIGCAGLIGGLFSKRGKIFSAVGFTVVSLFLTLFMGKLSWAAALMTDTLTAAALYTLIPDKIYMKAVNTAIESRSAVTDYLAQRISFGAECFAKIGDSTDRASELLAEKNSSRIDISETVCRKICGECRNRDFCCKSDENRIRAAFVPCEKLLLGKGFITVPELPRCIESCTKKAEIAELMNRLFSQSASLMRKSENHSRAHEIFSEQLSASVKFMDELGDIYSGGRIYDGKLSERAGEIIRRFGGKDPKAAVFFDKGGNLFISCFYDGKLEVPPEDVTEKLSALTDRELEQPEFFSEAEHIHACWHEPAAFEIEVGKAVLCGRESVSGDSSVQFTDGLGGVYFLIADGMGSGSRAALESSMACSLISKLIRAGSDGATALRLVNALLISKSTDEVFTTADMLRIDLFTGKADFFKAGAAQSFVRTGGTVSTVENSAFPLGIIPTAEPKPFSIRLSDGDSAALFSDGIPETSFPKLRELLLSDGYSPSRCADTVIELDRPEKGVFNDFSDDRTIIVLKLHKL